MLTGRNGTAGGTLYPGWKREGPRRGFLRLHLSRPQPARSAPIGDRSWCQVTIILESRKSLEGWTDAREGSAKVAGMARWLIDRIAWRGGMRLESELGCCGAESRRAHAGRGAAKR